MVEECGRGLCPQFVGHVANIRSTTNHTKKSSSCWHAAHERGAHGSAHGGRKWVLGGGRKGPRRSLQERLARSLRSAEAKHAYTWQYNGNRYGDSCFSDPQLLDIDAMSAALTDIKLLIPGKTATAPPHVVGPPFALSLRSRPNWNGLLTHWCQWIPVRLALQKCGCRQFNVNILGHVLISI